MAQQCNSSPASRTIVLILRTLQGSPYGRGLDFVDIKLCVPPQYRLWHISTQQQHGPHWTSMSEMELTVNDERARGLDHDPAGVVGRPERPAALEPADGRLGVARGLARQHGDRVHRQRLVGRADRNDGRRLVIQSRHLKPQEKAF